MHLPLLTFLTVILFATGALRAQDTVSIVFIGDVMQHAKQLKTALVPGGDTLLPESYDYTSYFSHTADMLSGADYAVANMEFSVGGAPFSGYPKFSCPETLPAYAQKAGIDLFLCANNHIYDRGQKGIINTMKTYERMGVDYTGIYRDTTARNKHYPFIKNIKGIKAAFINFTYSTNGCSGKAIVNMLDSVIVKKAIRRAKDSLCDIIIALPHWGEEYSLEISAQQRQWQKMLYREGVDIIIGSHPHVIQPVEVVRSDDGSISRLTAFSLGNFISNMSLKNTQAGYMFTLSMSKNRNGNISVTDASAKWIWCARGGRMEKNYTTIPISEYLDKKHLFPIKDEYLKMKTTYFQLQEIIKYGK